MPRLIRVENRITSPLEDRGFTVYRGWSDTVADQLVERSEEPEMLEHVPRDHAERFVSKDRANEWYSENERVVYALGEKAALAGIAWFTKHPIEDYDAQYTFAIRMYERARGKGLAGAFMMAAHLDLEASQHYEGAVWLDTDEGNVHARRLYERFGYNEISRSDDRIRMVKLGSAPVKHSGPPVFYHPDPNA
ncbi:MAG TPA: GNAT family N-acetyltransferase [Candidatus Saccharimonadales bacterium]